MACSYNWYTSTGVTSPHFEQKGPRMSNHQVQDSYIKSKTDDSGTGILPPTRPLDFNWKGKTTFEEDPRYEKELKSDHSQAEPTKAWGLPHAIEPTPHETDPPAHPFNIQVLVRTLCTSQREHNTTKGNIIPAHHSSSCTRFLAIALDGGNCRT